MWFEVSDFRVLDCFSGDSITVNFHLGSARPIFLAPVYLYVKTKKNTPSAGYSQGVISGAPEEGGGAEKARQEIESYNIDLA